MSKWLCMEGCGACCHLDPLDRPDIESYLSPDELQLYLTMVGEHGWCINYDHDTRKCNIYEDRPRFCRVKPDTFKNMYGVAEKDFNDFAVDCCFQQIDGVYGEDSVEHSNYHHQVFPN